MEENDAEEEGDCHVAEKIVCEGAEGSELEETGLERVGPQNRVGASLRVLLSPRCALEALLFSLPLGPRAQERARHMESSGNSY